MSDLGKGQAPAQSGPNCWQCRHFAITHIPSSPYACRSMGFQSRLIPSLEVLRVDGQFCRLFSPKAPPLKA